MEQPKANRIQKAIGKRFRKIITNSPDGTPPWLKEVGQGEDAGLFLPSDAPWVVHGDLATLIGGIRALLMQALHPGTLSGVATHSRYEQDPLGRLAGTTKWLTVTTFGSLSAIDSEAGRVNKMHGAVKGNYKNAQGEKVSYQASDFELLLWVHIAFTASFLKAHQLYSKKPIPGGADSYVSLWSKSVTRLGLEKCPMNEQQLNNAIKNFYDSKQLLANETTLKVIKFLKNPPLPKVAKIIYTLLFQAAAASIEKEYLELLKIKALPLWFVRPITHSLLWAMAKAIGSESPLETAAKNRLVRIGAWS
ncbi:MAG: hypothetical protein RL677_1090 [Actinomycetota bacterium]